MGLGLLFPLGIGIFALFDLSHLVDELLKSAHLDNRAVHVLRSETHRTHYLRELKKASAKVRREYTQICETDAQNMVTRVRNGDLSFGAHELAQLPAQSSVTRINPAPTTPFLSPLARPGGGPVPLQQPPINGQFGPASPLPSGTTQHINVPPAASLPTQPLGMLGRFANWLGGN